MSLLFDDVSRIVASPVSRRKMLGLVGGAVGGAVLASLGLGKPAAAFGGGGSKPTSPPGKTQGGGDVPGAVKPDTGQTQGSSGH